MDNVTVGQRVLIRGGPRWGLCGIVIDVRQMYYPPITTVSVRIDGSERITPELASNLKPRADE